MAISNYTPGRLIVGRLRHGADLLREINRVASEAGITIGTVSAIGGLKRATVAFLDQQTKAYDQIVFDTSMEIVSLSGNISTLDGKPFSHVHVALSDRNGNVVGGHLVEGCEIWACEVTIQELSGNPLPRSMDSQTGLRLWGNDAVL